MYAGIDLGSTNIKVALYDENLTLIDRQSRPVVYIRDSGFVEFDALRYAEDLASLLADMTKANGVGRIKEIAFTGQAESLVVLDGEGKPLMNAISWMGDWATKSSPFMIASMNSPSFKIRWSAGATIMLASGSIFEICAEAHATQGAVFLRAGSSKICS